ncbi:MAG: hypothetical protein M0P71_02910 [Melioribacteraceae bacterium]|nr:hypothetical protein [Melioribacteraceae bacterium]
MTIYRFLIIFLFFSSIAFSQELYLCRSFTEKGEPIDASLKFTLNTSLKNNIFILYDNVKVISDPLLYLYIDKKVNNRNQDYDSHVIRPDKNSTWIVYNYELKESGKYEIYIRNSKGNLLATKTITVWETSRNELDTPFSEIYYYSNVNVQFCEKVIYGKPINIIKTLSLKYRSPEVKIFVKSNKPLNTSLIKFEVWKTTSIPEYDKFIEIKKFILNKRWNQTFMKYTFKEKGDYKFIIYNDNEIIIKTIYISITD